ncbi:MAG: YibE/F family protein [bacterium]|nr:YibE/F family protein [bacterium]
MHKAIAYSFLSAALCAAFLGPSAALAQDTVQGYEDRIFKAAVVEILDEQVVEDEYTGTTAIQQNIKLVGLEGEWENKEITIDGINGIVVLEQQTYKAGDTVYVNQSIRPNQEDRFYVTDFVRTKSLWWMAGLFVLSVLAVARWKGMRALLVLGATFLIIIKFMVPQIIAGQNPLAISILGSIAILFLAIFGTEGFNKKSGVAFGAICIALLAVVGLSEWFTDLAHLSGLASEEAAYLLSVGDYSFDLRGVLLAGMVIGALGVLDDTVVSQVSLVKELTGAKPDMPPMAVFKTAMRVGTDHINAIINTLFLAYAGVSLPLLVLFVIYDQPTLSLEYVINGELIATEIVRTLAGSIALVLSVPIATALAVRAFARGRAS